MKKLQVLSGVLALVLFLSGCATGPKLSEMQGGLPLLADGKGRVLIYRTTVMGAAVQPDIRFNGEVVGSAKPRGFVIVDRPAGQYQISTSTEVNRTLSLTLDAGQTKYVRLGISMGFMVGHVYPELVEPAVGSKDIQDCSFLGSK